MQSKTEQNRTVLVSTENKLNELETLQLKSGMKWNVSLDRIFI